jgi:hypothetical protein
MLFFFMFILHSMWASLWIRHSNTGALEGYICFHMDMSRRYIHSRKYALDQRCMPGGVLQVRLGSFCMGLGFWVWFGTSLWLRPLSIAIAYFIHKT